MIEPVWLSWLLLLFFASGAIGVVAVLAGVGGAVLFVPLVGTLLPLHIDLVRGTGLFVALAGALAAAPVTLDGSLSKVATAIPFALAASLGSILGALVGVNQDPSTVRFLLGVLLLAVIPITAFATRNLADRAQVSAEQWVPAHRGVAAILFLCIGFLGGFFGVGAGWANVPLLVALCGAPLRVAAATSGLIILVNSATASWVYLAAGAVDPLITIASVAGMTFGSRFGARLLPRVPQGVIRTVVLLLLLFAALRSILEAL